MMARKPQPPRTQVKARPAMNSRLPSQPLVQQKNILTPRLQLPADRQHQQRLLDICSEVFGPIIASKTFTARLQEIKQALFNRDFAAAFGDEEYLQIYAARWSPTRGLCYASLLRAIERHIAGVILPRAGDEQVEGTSPVENIRIFSIGGCATELLAFSAYLQQTNRTGAVTMFDSGPWSSTVQLIHDRITSPATLSSFASASAKAANAPFLPKSQMRISFHQQDVLELGMSDLRQVIGDQPVLVTLFFTLNELYTSGGIGQTTNFLKKTSESLPHGSLLLVVDSPGSYSEAVIGREQKRYPMQWLLDHTLLAVEAAEYRWTRLESDDSIWFRLPDQLSYPISLENMRYQMHLYRIDRDAPVSPVK